MLSEDTAFPTGFDAVWFSQFLDCFSETEIVSILKRAAKALSPNAKIYIMETLWDRQKFETASYVLTQTSVYFTAMANGNSKMYHSQDFINLVEQAGLKVEKIYDNIGTGHTILRCSVK